MQDLFQKFWEDQDRKIVADRQAVYNAYVEKEIMDGLRLARARDGGVVHTFRVGFNGLAANPHATLFFPSADSVYVMRALENAAKLCSLRMVIHTHCVDFVRLPEV
jgi:hypothetical protein